MTNIKDKAIEYLDNSHLTIDDDCDRVVINKMLDIALSTQAREIFEEIEKILNEHSAITIKGKKDYLDLKQKWCKDETK